MALYINGRPVNPIVTFLVSAVVIAGIIGLGILLLPVIGGLFVIALLALRFTVPTAAGVTAILLLRCKSRLKKCCVAAHVLKRSSPSSRRCRTNLTLRPERPARASSA